MPIINIIMHPKHEYSMPMTWEQWEMHINGLTEIQYINLTRITSELKKLEFGVKGKKSVTAVYDICGAGMGRFPPLSVIRPFLKEIQVWGFDLIHMSCPARDELSMCILQKN